MEVSTNACNQCLKSRITINREMRMCVFFEEGIERKRARENKQIESGNGRLIEQESERENKRDRKRECAQEGGERERERERGRGREGEGEREGDREGTRASERGQGRMSENREEKARG